MKHLRDGDVRERIAHVSVNDAIRPVETDYHVAYNHGHRTALEEVLAAIAALPDAREWLPIETAPKDGTRILLFDKDLSPNTMIGRFDKRTGVWRGDSVPSGRYAICSETTHWQPLPDAPKEQGR